MNRKRKDYEELLEKYEELWRQKEELAYELNGLQMKETHLEEQSTQILELHESVRSIKHDMKNHMLVLATYLDEGDYASVQKYISEILDSLNSIHSYIETDNSLMNYILNQKLEKARQMKISVKAKVENMDFKKVESMDFTALLSNMLDNAIEACEKEDIKDLQVIIGKRRGYETILVKNRIRKSVLSINSDLVSRKDDKKHHGFGVKQIKSIVEKYDGMCDFYEEDNYFCVCAFIPE